jgi:ABC-2 type transport system permease protein
MRTMRLVALQIGLEQRAFWRNPDYAFFTFALPLGLLLVLGATKTSNILPGPGHIKATVLVVPGLLAFGVVVGAYANLAARIAVLRNDGVLKRVRTTPLRPAIYLTGQLASTLGTTLLIAVMTIVLGQVVFGVGPLADRFLPLVLAVALGILCFTAAALAISPLIRSADAASPIANATYLPLALVSGVFDPTLALPAWLTSIVAAFPIKALYSALRASYDPAVHTFPASALLVLAAWSAGCITIALRFFRWQP